MKKILLWLVVLVVIFSMVGLFTLSSCKKEAAPEEEVAVEEEEAAPAEEEVVPEKTKITFWVDSMSGAPFVNMMLAELVPAFNDQSETIEVEGTAITNMMGAARTALVGGGGPDVLNTGGPSMVIELALADQLLPLDEFVAEFGWSELFFPWALDLGKVEGKLYSLPDSCETLVLYYNKTLFEEKGWTPPTTIDELMILSEEIAAAGIIPFAQVNAEFPQCNEWFVGEFLNHVAGPEKVYEALTGQCRWDDPEFVQAIELLNEVQQNGWFQGGLDRYWSLTFDESSTSFGNGDAAMHIEGTWAIAGLSDYFGEKAGNNNDWGWVPMPSTTGEPIFDIGIGSTWSINKNAANPSAVAEFMSYYFSPEFQARVVQNGFPSAPVYLKAEALTGIDPRQAEIAVALGEASEAGNYGYTLWTFWPAKSDTYMWQEIDKVWSGEITAKQYLEGLQEVFTEEFEAGEVPPIPAR